jgi:hypothetical protein
VSKIKKIIPEEGGMDKKDFIRIKSTFEGWWTSLLVLTVCFIVLYISWIRIIQLIPTVELLRFFFRDRGTWFLKLTAFSLLALLIVIFKGLMYCVDGLVASWLKAPFAQMCHSINSSGLDYYQSNDITELLTEINEHFKETFKKFGVLTICAEASTILSDIADSVVDFIISSVVKPYKKGVSFGISVSDREKAKKILLIICSKNFIQIFFAFSLIVPIVFACYRVRMCRKMINNIKVEDE